MSCDTWPVDTSCLPTDWPADSSEWTDAQTQAVDVASEILRRLTAGTIGLCTRKVRPCRQRSLDQLRSIYAGTSVVGGGLGGYGGLGVGQLQPMLVDGRVVNLGCPCTGACGCGPLPEITLDPPAYDVLTVRVDGTVVPPLYYRVDDFRRLVRTDGGTWPDCQDLVKPDTEPGTFSVLYRTGTPVPPGGRSAMTELAREIWKACTGSKNCRLPERVTQVVRDGVSYTLIDNLDVFDRGRTGLRRVDLWLAAVNPYGTRTQMAVYSPDLVRSRRETDTVLTPPDLPPTQGAGSGYFHWVQDLATTSMTIDHELGYKPSGIELFSMDWEIRYASFSVVNIDDNRLNITTEAPFRGHVILG